MIVDDEEFVRVELECTFQDGAHRKAGLIRRALGQEIIAKQLVPTIEIKHPYAFDPAVRRDEVEIIVKLIAIRQ